MGSSDVPDEHQFRVKRGAFPTPESEIERADRFVPESAGVDETDDDPTPSDSDDAMTPRTEGAGGSDPVRKN